MEVSDISTVKLAVFDLDDTLLNHGAMSEKDHEAVCSLRKRGIVTVTATSRDKEQISDYVKECFDYLITISGASVETSGGDAIFHACIDKSDVRAIVKELRHTGAKPFLSCNGHLIMSFGSCIRLLTSRPLKDVLKNKSSGWNSEITLKKDLGCLKSSYRIFRVCGIFRTRKALEKAMLRFSGRKGINVVSDSKRIIELINATASKEKALSLLCRKLSIDRKDIIAFGDSCNDIEMLLKSGISVAMENGDNNLKNTALIIAPAVTLSGVSVVIEKLFGSSEGLKSDVCTTTGS